MSLETTGQDARSFTGGRPCHPKRRSADFTSNYTRLEQISTELVIPSGVADEIEFGPIAVPAQEWLRTVGRTHVRPVENIESEIALWDFGRGESEVLAWARRHLEFTAVLDDRAARRCADVLNLSVCGTVGVLMRAKRRGLCAQLAPVLDAVASSGLYVAPSVRREALRLVGQ